MHTGQDEYIPDDFWRKLQAIFFSLLMITSVVSMGGVGMVGAAETQQTDDSSTNAIEIATCGVTLNETGATYHLTQNLTTSSGACLTIANNSITLDGMGHTITGDIDPDEFASDRTHGITTDLKQRSDIVVKNVTIRGFDTDDSAGINFRSIDNSTIANVHTEDNYYGIHLDSSDGSTGSSNITIDQVTATNNARAGILLGDPGWVGANNNTIRDSTITNNGGEGIHLVGGSGGSSDNTIVGNTLTGNGERAAGEHYGIRVFGGENNEIRDNVIAENTRGGIALLNDAYNTTIEKNVVRDHSGQTALDIGYATGTTIADNEIHDNGRSIDLGDFNQAPDTVISGNEFSAGGQYDLWVRSDAPNSTITGNSFSGFSTGEVIYVQRASGVTVANNIITDSPSGIYLQDAPDVTVTDNVVHVTDNAVRLQELSSVSVTNLDLGTSTAANTTVSLTTGEMGSNDNIWVYASNLPPENTVNESVERYFDVRGTPPLSVEVGYSEEDIDGLDETLLSLWEYDGTAWVSVDGSSVDTDRNVVTADLTEFNVSSPPSTFGVFADPLVSGLSVERPTINETDISVGQSVLVDAAVVNNGSVEGDLTVELEIDDIVVDSQIVTVPAGEQETAEFVYTFTEAGVYAVSVNGVFAGTVNVGDDAVDVAYSDLSVSATEIYTGSSVSISATIENVGSAESEYTAPLVVDGDLVDTMEGTLSVDETETVTFFYQFDVGGSYDVTIGDLTHETVTVTPAWTQFGFGDNNVGSGPALTGPVVSAEERWNYTAGSQSWHYVRSSPAVVDGVVYVGSWPPMVHAVDAESGEQLWTVDTDGPVLTAPAVADGVVYATSSEGTVYAIDTDGGTVLWSEPIGEPLTSPRIVAGELYVGSEDGSLYALEPADGSELWSFDTERQIKTTPAVSNGVVYVATSPKSGQSGGEKVYAIDVTSGTELWSADEPMMVDTALTVVDGVVYVADFSGTVHAYDAGDGTWLWDAGVSSSAINAAPTVAEDVVYVGSDDNHVYALDAADGTELWAFETGGNVRSSPAVADGALYVGSNDASLYALNANTGDELWAFDTGDSVWSSPAVLDGVVYVGSQDAKLYAVQETSEPVVGGALEVTIDSTNEPVTAGETLVVTATITNTGDVETTETVELRDGATVLDSVDVTLGAGASDSIEFIWETTEDDTGVFDLSVVSPSDTDTVTVTVDAPSAGAFFAVTIDDTNEPIEAGETLAVSATIANTGDAEGTQTVELVEFDGTTVVDSTPLTLAADATETLVLNWSGAPEGTGDVTVRTEDDNATRTVAIGADTAVGIESCRVIDTSGNYVLSGDLSGEDTCITITASNVTVDGGGHTIVASNATGSDRGIHVTGIDGRIENVTVTNVVLEGWDNGVRFQYVDDSELSNVVVENGSTGVVLSSSHGNELTDLTIRDNDRRALSLSSSNSNVISGIEATGNEADTTFSGRGSVYLFSSSNNEFADVSVADGRSGVRIALSSGNEFVGLTTERHANYGLEVGSNSNTFTDVVANDNGWHGVQIQTASFNTFENVSVTGTDGSAVRLTGIGGSGGAPQNNLFETLSVTDNDGAAVSLSVANYNTFRNVTTASNTGTAVTFVSRSEGNLVELGEIGHRSNTAVNFGPDSVGNTIREVSLLGSGTPFIAQDGAPNNEFDRVDIDGTVVSLSARGVGTYQTSPSTLPADVTPIGSYLGVTPHSASTTHVEFLRFHYEMSDVDSLDESELAVWRLSDEWESPTDAAYVTGVDTDQQYVFASGIDESDLSATFGAFAAEVSTDPGDDGTDDDDSSSGDDGTDDDGTGDDGTEQEPEGPFFAVSIVETTSPVTAGQTLEVTAVVENTGEETGTGTIELLADGTIVDSTSVTLSSGDDGAVVLSWATTADDVAETIPIEVRSDDDATTAVVTVEPVDEDAEIVLYGARAQSDTVSIDETLTVVGDFYNLGTTTGGRTVTLFVDGEAVDDATVTVSPGLARGAAQLTWSPTESDIPDGAAEADVTVSLDGLLVGTVTVENPYSDIQVIAASSSSTDLVAGEEAYVVGSIYQAGTIEASETLGLTAENVDTGEMVVLGSQESPELAPGYYYLGALNVSYSIDEAGTYELRLGDRSAGTVEVAAAYSEIQVIAASTSVVELVAGEETYAVGSIYQAGTIAGSETVELTAENVDTGEEFVLGSQESPELAPGYYYLGAINVSYTIDEAGTYALTLGERSAGTVEVAAAYSEIQVIAASTSAVDLVAGEEAYVIGSIYQAGTLTGSETIDLTAENVDTGEMVVLGSQESPELDPGYYYLGALNVSYTIDEAGTYDLRLGDRSAGTVEVEAAYSDIAVIAASSSVVEFVAGEGAYVVGSIYQGGTIEGSETFELTAENVDTGEEFVLGSQDSPELDPGYYYLGALNVTYAIDEAGTYDLTLGDRPAGTVEVLPSNSDIRVIAASVEEIELVQGETTFVIGSTYQAGTDDGPQRITLQERNLDTNETRIVGEQTVSLQPGYYHLGGLNVSYTPEDAGSYELTLGDRVIGIVAVDEAITDIRVIGASVSAVELVEGEELFVTGSIYQAGTVEGSQTIELTAENVDTGEVAVVGSQETNELQPGFYHLGALNITYTPEAAGTYDLTLGDRSAGTVEVEAAYSDIQVIAASTSEVDLVAGEEAYVIGSIYQAGTIAGSETVELTAENVDTGEIIVLGSQESPELDPGYYYLGALNVSYAIDEAGTYDLRLGDRPAGTVEVEAAYSDIQVIAASTSVVELVAGEEAFVIGSIYQTGTITGSETVDLVAENVDTGEEFVLGSQESPELAPGYYYLGALNVSYTLDEAGTYDLRLGGRNAGTVEVEAAYSDIQVIAASTSEVDLVAGEEAYVTGSLYQAGSIAGSETIDLTAENADTGEIIVLGSQETDELRPGWYHLGALNVSYTIDEPGTYDLRLGDRNAGTVEVVAGIVDVTVVSVEGQGTGFDVETDELLVYTSHSATVDVDVESDAPLDEVTLLVSSQATTFAVTATGTHVSGDRWTIDVPLEDIPDDGRYDLTVVAADVGDTGDIAVADEVLVVDRTGPSLSVSIENVDSNDATIVIESNEPLDELSSVTAEFTDQDGSTATETVTMTRVTDSRFTGTLEFEESGEYSVTAVGVDRAGNEGTDTASVTINTGFTLNDGEIIIDSTGTSILFDIADDADEAIKAQELFIALSENSVNPNVDGGDLGVGFITADLDSFIDYQLEQGTIQSATISMAVDGSSLPSGTSASDAQMHYYDQSAGQWDPVETEYEVVDGDPFLVSTVSHFSTYGALIVDDRPPTIDSVDISPRSPVNGDDVTVTFAYSPVISDIDVSATAVTVSGVDAERLDIQITTSSTTVEINELTEGEHIDIGLTLVDKAGNEATETASTGISATDPGSDSSSPADESTDNGDGPDETDGQEEEASSDDSGPGMGLVLAIISLLLFVVVTNRRQRQPRR